MVSLIGADEHIIADFSDNFDGDIFLLRVRDGDKIRMVPIKHLAADGAAAAGCRLSAAENGSRQQHCQCVFAAAFGTADQVEMGNVSPAQAAC